MRKFKIGEEVTSPSIPKEYEHKGIVKSISTIKNIDFICRILYNSINSIV
jgi:hypothetical protein